MITAPPIRCFNWLQALRGFSVLIVLLHHAGNIVELNFGDGRLYDWFRFGRGGVDMFFVLSGFILMYLHLDDVGQPETAWTYTRKRFVRVYPLYWFYTALVLGAALLIDGAIKPHKFEPLRLLETFTMVPIFYSELPVISPGWSLFHEVKFYAMFLLLLAFRRPWNLLITGALVAANLGVTAWITATGGLFDHAWHAYWIGPYNVAFIAGVFAGWWVRRAPPGATVAWSMVVAGLAVLVAGSWSDIVFDDSQLQRLGQYGLAGLLLTTGLVALEVRPGAVRAPPNWLVRLGDASYTAYLLHYPLMFILARIMNLALGRDTMAAWPLTGGAVLLAVSVAASWYAYRWIEVPLLRWSRQRAGLARGI
ncbi:MAG TPA: acyltransferase [Kiritimatiellia bacterium]|nr:acyltransferase [Kiritimatiellia bacterium]HMP33434.1 acyltransferase [Kiritimatiellia bacterium]